ncbi:hypothetical protein IHE45_16G072200 [Dioscorea alata]|uniref:Uncharacterized protein n=1 Tax=Dioscorea alata TaxID=55571 RepID=A0ACB7UIG6_DIOAL|nr:hypothetical protein IHE45_16G072200 [Dioscorea alata]
MMGIFLLMYVTPTKLREGFLGFCKVVGGCECLHILPISITKLCKAPSRRCSFELHY